MNEDTSDRDDIDRIVEALLENPDRAADIKTMLRSKMLAPEVVHMVAPRAAEATGSDDTEDFWDNVPV